MTQVPLERLSRGVPAVTRCSIRHCPVRVLVLRSDAQCRRLLRARVVVLGKGGQRVEATTLFDTGSDRDICV